MVFEPTGLDDLTVVLLVSLCEVIQLIRSLAVEEVVFSVPRHVSQESELRQERSARVGHRAGLKALVRL